MKVKGIYQSESVYVSSLIKKLSPSWYEFGRGLRHKPEYFSLDKLFVALHIEDKVRSSSYKVVSRSDHQAKALVVEYFFKT